MTFPVNSSFDLDALLAILDSRYAPIAGAPIVTPVTPPAPSGTFWVYQNGVFAWAGDYSFGTGPINYADTVGKPGGKCISVPIVSPWGGFQPFAAGGNFDLTPYKYLTYSLKPTLAGALFATGFAAVNDVADGTSVITAGVVSSKYGPVLQAGVWSTYKIPLADFKLTNLSVLKFSIADGTGVKTNQFYVDNIGFTAA
jgi:hypothetical protein